MTEKELKRLSRADLLEMLIAQSVELRETEKKLQCQEEQMMARQITIDEAGSIAEAALRLNGVFEAAQAACEEYINNIRVRSAQQEEICARRDAESNQKAAALLQETERHCAELKAEAEAYCENLNKETEQKCEEMMRQRIAENAASSLESQCTSEKSGEAGASKKKGFNWLWKRRREKR